MSSAVAICHHEFRPLAQYILRRGRGSTVIVVINHCSLVVGFRLSSSISRKTLSLLLGPISGIAALLCQSVTPTAENNINTDFAGKPLQPNSLVKFHVCHPLFLPTVHHTLSPFFHWLHHISPPRELSAVYNCYFSTAG